MKIIYIVILSFLLAAGSAALYAEEEVGRAENRKMPNKVEPEKSGISIDKKTNPVIRMITPGIFEIGGIRLDKENGTVEFDAVINMDKGLLEYLIVEKSGKTHESLLSTEIEPYNLQIALLLVGLEGTLNPLSGQGDPAIPDGDPVSIHVKWVKDNKIMEHPIEDWIFNRGADSSLAHMNWVFTGSFISDGVFMAQVEKSIAALFHDPASMIDNPMPEGASDEIWYVDEKTVPPTGTKVTVKIKNKKEEKNR